MGPSKGGRQKRMLPSTLNDGAVVSGPLQSCHTGSPREPMKITATVEDEVKGLNSSVAHRSSDDGKPEKAKRFIAFIGKPN